MEKIGKVLLLVLLFTMICTNAFAYSDTSGAWYEETVNYATKQGIINGYQDNTFRAEKLVSKAEAIKLVVARYADNISSITSSQHWATNYVKFAEENNIIPKGMFNETNLDLPASRKEICYMLIQSCRNLAYKPVLDNTDMVLDFNDLNEQNKQNINENGIDYAQAMRLCYAMGIIKGYPASNYYTYIDENGKTVEAFSQTLVKLVKPNENVTRAEAATMVARAYFAKYRQYTLIERTGNQLPSNSSDFVETYTYMPKAFYEDGKDTFFKYLPNKKPVNFFEYYRVDKGVGKARLEEAYDVLYNISYKMSDEQWQLWKEEMTIFEGANDFLKKDSEFLDKYIDFIKQNKIVIRGGAIMDPSTIGTVESNLIPDLNFSTLIKGIGALYIENPNNIEVLSIERLYTDNIMGKFNKTLKQQYIFTHPGGLQTITNSYFSYMDLHSYFVFSNEN